MNIAPLLSAVLAAAGSAGVPETYSEEAWSELNEQLSPDCRASNRDLMWSACFYGGNSLFQIVDRLERCERGDRRLLLGVVRRRLATEVERDAGLELAAMRLIVDGAAQDPAAELARFLSSPHPRVRVAAAENLALHGERGIRLTERSLSGESERPEAELDALRALVAGRREAASDSFALLMASRELSERRSGLESLRAMGRPFIERHERALMRMRGDRDQQLAVLATQTLGILPSSGGGVQIGGAAAAVAVKPPPKPALAGR